MELCSRSSLFEVPRPFISIFHFYQRRGPVVGLWVCFCFFSTLHQYQGWRSLQTGSLDKIRSRPLPLPMKCQLPPPTPPPCRVFPPRLQLLCGTTRIRFDTCFFQSELRQDGDEEERQRRTRNGVTTADKETTLRRARQTRTAGRRLCWEFLPRQFILSGSPVEQSISNSKIIRVCLRALEVSCIPGTRCV